MAEPKQYLDAAGLTKVFDLLAAQNAIVEYAPAAIPDPATLPLGKLVRLNGRGTINTAYTVNVNDDCDFKVGTVFIVISDPADYPVGSHKYMLLSDGYNKFSNHWYDNIDDVNLDADFSSLHAYDIFSIAQDMPKTAIPGVEVPEGATAPDNYKAGSVFMLANKGTTVANSLFIYLGNPWGVPEIDMADVWKSTDYVQTEAQLVSYMNDDDIPYGSAYIANQQFSISGVNFLPPVSGPTVVPVGTIFVKNSFNDEWLTITPPVENDMSDYMKQFALATTSNIPSALANEAVPYGSMFFVNEAVPIRVIEEIGAYLWPSIGYPEYLEEGTILVKTKAAVLNTGSDKFLVIPPMRGTYSEGEIEDMVFSVAQEND